MKHAISYLKTLSLMLEARKRGNEVDEDRHLDELDVILLKLSRLELLLIRRISMYLARDMMSLSNLKKLITRLEQEPASPVVSVRIYRVQSGKKTVPKRSSLCVFRSPRPVETGRKSAIKLSTPPTSSL